MAGRTCDLRTPIMVIFGSQRASWPSLLTLPAIVHCCTLVPVFAGFCHCYDVAAPPLHETTAGKREIEKEKGGGTLRHEEDSSSSNNNNTTTACG
ncbi:uncharacterized protein PG986_007100 [Apiospora aurea]|uniref:Secreted protein n=1 Tax=Apiospora aurea TaxID=335848 RepID=A0ABR1QBM6_9PEZI